MTETNTNLFEVLKKYNCFYTEVNGVGWFVDHENLCEKDYAKRARDLQITEDILKHIDVYSLELDIADIPVCRTNATAFAERMKKMMYDMTSAEGDTMDDYPVKFIGYMTNIFNGNAKEEIYRIAGRYIQ